MRSANVLVILILVNAGANFMAVSGLAADLGVQPTAGQDVQAQVEQRIGPEASNLDPRSGVVESAIGLGFAIFSFLSDLFTFLFAGPLMFRQLGVPGPLVGLIFAPLYAMVGLDLFQAFAGRNVA
jgi:hypothetical protein